MRKPDNSVITMKVPKDYVRFDALKVGDKVTATYYDNIVIRKKEPGEKDVNTDGGVRDADRPEPSPASPSRPSA